MILSCTKDLRKILLENPEEFHPVLILLGDVEQSLDCIKDLNLEESKFFEISKDTLDSLDQFCIYYGHGIKTALCVIRSVTDVLVGALLKRLEDLPKFIRIVLISNDLPKILLNRGLVFRFVKKIHAPEEVIQTLAKNPSDILSSNLDDEVLFKAVQLFIERNLLQGMIRKDKTRVEIMYDIWDKLLEVNGWLMNNQIKTRDAVEMMVSIIKVASL